MRGSSILHPHPVAAHCTLAPAGHHKSAAMPAHHPVGEPSGPLRPLRNLPEARIRLRTRQIRPGETEESQGKPLETFEVLVGRQNILDGVYGRPAGFAQTQPATSRPVCDSSVTLPWSLTWKMAGQNRRRSISILIARSACRVSAKMPWGALRNGRLRS